MMLKFFSLKIGEKAKEELLIEALGAPPFHAVISSAWPPTPE